MNKNIAKVKQMENQLKEAENATKNFGKSTEGSMKSALSGVDILNISMGNLVAEGIEMAIQALIELAKYTLEWAETMEKVSAQTGMTTTELQKWEGVLKQTGGDLDTLSGALADFQERILDASSGTG